MTTPASAAETILIRVTGVDQPGITTAIMGILAHAGAVVLDIEQMVVRGRLNLEVVVDVSAGHDVLKDVLLVGWERDLDVDFDVVDEAPVPSSAGLVVSVLGPSLSPADLQAVTAGIAKAGGNIERIQRLANEPVYCYEFEVRGGDGREMRAHLLDAAAAASDFDVAIQRTGLARRSQRLIVLDVDSTLIQNEMIDLLAAEAGIGDACAAITDSAMAGTLDFEESLRQRVRLLEGQPREIIDRAYLRLELTDGAERFVRTVRRLGYRIAIVSGGFNSFTDRLRSDLGIDYSYANTLEVRDGVLTGGVTGPIVDRNAKASLLQAIAQQEGVSLEQVVAVGDGANDLDMLSAAGLGIAFCAKPVVRDRADTTLSAPHLDAVLFLLGFRREDVDDADA
ncbi:MAG: phosphoserine phosphatase SerB [Acidimicrobiales bacterium]